MSERKLAHIERVVKIEPIEGADKIEKATVLGWEVIVRKGEVRENDLVAYVEVDSIVPAIPYFDFMADKHYRVKTIKLRKQVSQGLIIPLDHLGKINSKLDIRDTCFYEGEDLTELLGITKHISKQEHEAYFTSKKKYGWFIKYMTRFQWFRSLFHMRSKSFPEFIPKTDEDRIQNMPWVLKDKVPGSYYVTEKLDGMSATFAKYKNKYYICSRNVLKSELDSSTWSRAFKQFDIKDKLYCFNENIAIQGEIIGAGIQGNKYKFNNEIRFFVYNIWDIDKKRYYTYDELFSTCIAMNLLMVPVLYRNYTLPDTVKELVDLSKGTSKLANVQREGIVIRNKLQTGTDRASFKVINPDFLLKYEE